MVVIPVDDSLAIKAQQSRHAPSARKDADFTALRKKGRIEMRTELQEFLRHWERETDGTLALLRALPTDQYDFRPDTGGRSIGELAWHVAEVDAYVSLGIDQGEFKFDTSKPPHHISNAPER